MHGETIKNCWTDSLSFLHLQQSVRVLTPRLKKVSLLGILSLAKQGNVCCSNMQFLNLCIPPWWMLRHRTLKVFVASPTLFCWDRSVQVLQLSALLQSLNPHSPKCVLRCWHEIDIYILQEWMKSIANVHLYQFLPVHKGKRSYRQICRDTGQFDPITNCSHSTSAAVREDLLKRQYKLTVGKP